MKKVTLSIVAVSVMNTFVFAGGDIAPVEPQITVPEVAETTGSFYIGAGYAYMNLDSDGKKGQEHDGDAALVLAGYNFNHYIGVEARYAGFTDCLENSAIYVKPMYPIGDAKVYALLGYGETSYENGVAVDDSESGFQWGLGASYTVTENIGVFADYTNLYDDSGFNNGKADVTVDSINVGVAYTF